MTSATGSRNRRMAPEGVQTPRWMKFEKPFSGSSEGNVSYTIGWERPVDTAWKLEEDPADPDGQSLSFFTRR